MEIYSILDCEATALRTLFHFVRNDNLSSRVSETNVAIQDKIVLYLKFIWIASLPLAMTVKGNLDCFATARNDGQRNLDCFTPFAMTVKGIWIAKQPLCGHCFTSFAMMVKGA